MRKAKVKKPQRRPKGKGSVETVGSKFRARIVRSRSPHCGTLRDTWDEAFLDLPALIKSVEQAEEERSLAPRFEDFMLRQLQGPRATGPTRVSYNTWKNEEVLWRTRVQGSSLGIKRVDEITDEDCQEWLDAQRLLVPVLDGQGRQCFIDDKGEPIAYGEDGKPAGKGHKVMRQGTKVPSRSYIIRMGGALHSYFEILRAKPLRLIAANPMEDVVYPKESKDAKKRKSLLPKQAASLKMNLLKFITELSSQGVRFEAMVMTQRDSGLRRGELCVIKWPFVMRAADGPIIRIEESRTRTEEGYADLGTKSGKYREIPITEETYERIMALPKRSEYAFTTESGKPVSPDNYNRDFAKFRKSIGMPDLKPHHLRNTYISLMLRAGVDVKTIQTLVGHASPKMIMEIYAETFNESMREASTRMAKLLSDAEEKSA